MIWNREEVNRVSTVVFNLVGCEFEYALTAYKEKGLSVSWDGDNATITAEDISALARGCFLLALAKADGKHKLYVNEKRHIASCGVMLDCSRGAVLTVEACKRYINCLAALGLNLMMLYTEDTYTVPEFPYLGHLRGRYTREEMNEIDQYAISMGVELVPCIQTLGHMSQFLQWNDSYSIVDNWSCLLIDEERTYELIEAEIRACRSFVKTNRIHIGMDEAEGVGLGRYFSKHGFTDRYELLTRHLNRIVDICRKYGFHPMMWSDMFFRLNSKDDRYYEIDSHIPQKVIDKLPPVDMVYWDYTHNNEEMLNHMFLEHARMGTNTVYAGGIWTWLGFLPNEKLTEANMYPAMRCCLHHNVQTAFATMWGDNGNETNQFLALNQLPIMSEFCWRGEACTQAEIYHVGVFLTGIRETTLKAFNCFFDGASRDTTGKALVYSDILYYLLKGHPNLEECVARYKDGKALLKAQPDRPECRYASALFDICIAKAQAIMKIRKAYATNDMSALLEIAETDIPEMIALYDVFEDEHRVQWESTFKRQGWENYPERYGAVRGRLRDVSRVIKRYVNGDLATICELDEPMLDAARGQVHKSFMTPLL